MSEPIEYVETETEDWEGYRRDLFTEELVKELVEKVNELTYEVNRLRGTPGPRKKKPWED